MSSECSIWVGGVAPEARALRIGPDLISPGEILLEEFLKPAPAHLFARILPAPGTKHDACPSHRV